MTADEIFDLWRVGFAYGVQFTLLVSFIPAALGAGGSGNDGLVAVLMGGGGIVGHIELGNGDPAVAGLLGHELHIADSLSLEVHVLLALVGGEGGMLGNQDPLGLLGLLDIQAGLGDLAAVVALTGGEGELVDGVDCAEVDDTGEGVLTGQLVGGTLPVGVPDGGGVAVEGVLEQTLLPVVAGLGVNGDLGPEAAQLAEGIDLLGGGLVHGVQVELGAVAAPAADAAGVAQVVAVLVGLQALDGPACALVVDQLEDVAGLVQGGGIAADVQVAALILELVAALSGLQGPEDAGICDLVAGTGGQGVGAPCAAALQSRQKDRNW